MSKVVDIKDQRFGYLTVLERDMSKIGRNACWICQCDCGNVISVRGDRLRSGRTKSCGCLQKEIASKQRIIDLTNQKFGHLTVLKQDLSKDDKNIYWICQCECGNIVSIRGDHLRYNNTTSCGCINSKGENKIKEILSALNVSFIQQKTFNNLKYKSNLRFDFFLPDYKCCIEYNGKQHYEEVKYFGGKENLETQQKRDNIKRQWCKENNIKLIEIPYWDFDKLNENYLKQLI